MNEFYSVIQLLATLAIGFAILGYSEYFIKTLTNFFHADDIISEAERRCRSLVPDKATRDNLAPAKIGNGDTIKTIEELKIECNKMDNKINEFMKHSKSELEKMSRVRSLVSMSFFVFLVSVLLLFIPCLPNLWQQCNALISNFIIPFTSASIFYILMGWIFGEKDYKSKILGFCSLKHSIVCFAIIIVFSILFAIISLFLKCDFGDAWRFPYITLISMGWINFLMYAFFIKHSMNQFKTKVDELIGPIISECNSKELIKRGQDLIMIKQMEIVANNNTHA